MVIKIQGTQGISEDALHAYELIKLEEQNVSGLREVWKMLAHVPPGSIMFVDNNNPELSKRLSALSKGDETIPSQYREWTTFGYAGLFRGIDEYVRKEPLTTLKITLEPGFVLVNQGAGKDTAVFGYPAVIGFSVPTSYTPAETYGLSRIHINEGAIKELRPRVSNAEGILKQLNASLRK